MADVLIRGIDPKIIDLTVHARYNVLVLPERHGDLMDKTAFEIDIRRRYCRDCDNSNGLKCRACWVDDMSGEVEDAPTVIAAEGGQEDG